MATEDPLKFNSVILNKGRIKFFYYATINFEIEKKMSYRQTGYTI